MRECKPSDVQALEVIVGAVNEISIELTMIRGKLLKLKTEVQQYLNEQQEPIDVQTTHGFSPDQQ
jgi:hypothetical protein